MNKLARYYKIKNLVEKLKKEQESLKDDIVTEIKALDGKNKDKELVIENYVATVTYAKKTEWNEKAIDFFMKKDKECLTIKVDNKVIEVKENKGIFTKEELDKMRTFSWDSPRLYVKNKEEK